MRVAIVGAGAVGRSIAGELLGNGHTVMLIEKDGRKVRTRAVQGPSGSRPTPARCPPSRRPSWPPATSSSPPPVTTRPTSSSRCWPRPSSRSTAWSPRSRTRASGYTDAWEVDVAVSTPRVLAALVEAVTVGDVVRLMSFRKGAANLVEITLAEDTPWVGKALQDGVPLPARRC